LSSLELAWEQFLKKHVLVGVGGAVALFLLYLGVVTLAQGLRHALEQAAALWYWIAALAVGFGVQAALFSYVRSSMRQRRASTTASVTASGGVSAGSMLACCAHHLSDVLPMLGIAGAAGFLAQYQNVFLLVGVAANVVGITVMLEAVQCLSLPGSRLLSRWDMVRVKKWTMGLAVVGVSGAAAVIFWS